jgi:multiple sugar transport system permease protein
LEARVGVATERTAELRRRFWTRARSEAALGYLLLVPALSAVVFTIGWPLVRSLWLSLHELYLIRGFDSQTFVGLKQYVKLWNDPNLLIYLKNQAVWVTGVTILPVVVGLVFALVLNEPLRGRWLWRGLVLIPWSMPNAVTAMAWQWIYSGQWGILNHHLSQLGFIQDYVNWLIDPVWMWPAILVTATWRYFPFNYVVLLSSLQGISQELYDAAKVDGANARQLFLYVTLPHLLPMLGVLTILGIIWTMNDFTSIWMLTGGGPGVDTTTLAPLVYRTSFQYFRLGYGAAIGVVLMLFSGVFALIYIRRVRYEYQ